MTKNEKFEMVNLAGLQDVLAMIDMLSRPSRRGGSGSLELLLKKLDYLRLTMDGDDRHARPHLHLDYGKQKHSASFAIDDGTRLVGNVSTTYDRAIANWIDENRAALMEVWLRVRKGGDYGPFVEELKASKF